MTALTSPWIVTALAAAMSAYGCGGSPTEDIFSQRDSADVVIKTSRGPKYSDRTWLTIERSPIAAVRSDAQGAPLFGTRAGVIFNDGTFVIGLSDGNLLQFDGTGLLIHRWAQPGARPGEMQAVTWLQLDQSGDTLFAWDARLRRLSRFVRTSGFTEATLYPGGALIGVTLHGHAVSTPSISTTMRAGAGRDSALVLIEQSGLTVDTLGTVVGQPYNVFMRAGTGLTFSADNIETILRPPFRPGNIPFVTDEFVRIIDGDKAEVHTLIRGGVSAIWQLGVPRYPILENHIDEWKLNQEETSGRSDIRRLRRQLAALRVETHFPAFDTWTRATNGDLWLKAFSIPGARPTSAWYVVNPQGQWLGTVTLSNSTHVLAVGHGLILLRNIDDFGDESVRLHRLIGPT